MAQVYPGVYEGLTKAAIAVVVCGGGGFFASSLAGVSANRAARAAVASAVSTAVLTLGVGAIAQAASRPGFSDLIPALMALGIAALVSPVIGARLAWEPVPGVADEMPIGSWVISIALSGVALAVLIAVGALDATSNGPSPGRPAALLHLTELLVTIAIGALVGPIFTALRWPKGHRGAT